MANEAVIIQKRRMNTFHFGLIIVTFITDLRALVLDRIQAVIALVVTACRIMTGSTFFVSQATMDERRCYLTRMALVTGLTGHGINSCSY